MKGHPDRSVPGFPATQHWRRPRVRPSVRRAHEVRQRHQLPQEIRGSEVEGPAVSIDLFTKRSMEAPPSPLSSRKSVTFLSFRVYCTLSRMFFNPNKAVILSEAPRRSI